jgi:hypothetical protein
MYILVLNSKIIAWSYDTITPFNGYEVHEITDRPSTEISDCYWTGSDIALKTTAMILAEYKIFLKKKLFEIIGLNWVESVRSADEIQAQWISFKSNAVNWTTIEVCNLAFNNAITWLGLSDDFKI